MSNYEAEERKRNEELKILRESKRSEPSVNFDDDDLRRILRETRNPELYSKKPTALTSAERYDDIEKGVGIVESETCDKIGHEEMEGGHNEYIAVPEETKLRQQLPR